MLVAGALPPPTVELAQWPHVGTAGNGAGALRAELTETWVQLRQRAPLGVVWSTWAEGTQILFTP